MSHPGIAHSAGVPYDFAEFERRAAQRRRRVRWRTRTLRGAWLATLLTVTWLAWQGARPDGAPRPAPAELGGPVLVDEHWLASVEPNPIRVQVDTRLASVALEQQIAIVDDLFSDALVSSDPLLTLRRLESERARLVDALFRVRQAEALILDAR
jgi:hypothetical protein